MTLPDPTRLSRRDRAALTLALECLRTVGIEHGDRDARDATSDATGVIACVEYAAPVSRAALHALERCSWRNVRMIRARFALLLRAVLRADDADRKAATLGLPAAILMRWHAACDGCGESLPNYAIGDLVNVCPKRGGHPVARQARPLWEHAPQTRPR